MPTLLHYRSWQGTFHSSWWTIWPIARLSLKMVLRRIMFWVLDGFASFLFLMFFFGNFLLAWAQARVEVSAPQIGQIGGNPERMLAGLRRAISVLNGSQETFQYFFWYQGGIVVVTLALVGSILVGNDFTFKSLVFYLSKPISRWHYILGKCLAVFFVVQLMTTLPALLLYAQRAFDDWNYLLDVDYFRNADGKGPAGVVLLLAIIGYGTLLSTFLSILLVATASWMRRTMPLILVWMSLFFFLRLLANILVDGLKLNVNFRLIDLWNNLTLLGQALLGFTNDADRHPPDWAAALVLLGVTALCLIYLNHRTRGVEIVS
jgi:ABC-type transport system involved in multi-copper enzyme maturation permease subunit